MAQPIMHAVVSSNVAAVGYDEEEGNLLVQYKASPRVYIYIGVPKAELKKCRDASSVGAYIAQNIKPHYQFV